MKIERVPGEAQGGPMKPRVVPEKKSDAESWPPPPPGTKVESAPALKVADSIHLLFSPVALFILYSYVLLFDWKNSTILFLSYCVDLLVLWYTYTIFI